MANLFDNAKRQLQAGDPGPHPEAEVLNAYMEDALSPRERAPLVEHLSRCAACREVVALAAPPVPDAARPALKDPAIRLALWRWAVVAITAVVVLGAVLFKTPQRDESTVLMSAKQESEAKPQTPAPATAAPQTPAAEPQRQERAARADKDVVSSPAREQKKETNQLAALSPKPAAPAQPVATPAPEPVMAANEPVSADTLSAKGTSSGMRDAGVAAMAKAAPAPPPPQQQKAMDAAPAVQAEVAMDRQANFADDTARQAAPVKMKSTRVAAAPAAASGAKAATVSAVSAQPRWTISEGEVQRSTDAGLTWQTIRVAAGANFRAVAAIGAEVWAGGAALYHSTDAGNTWSRITLPAHGEFVRIDFADPQHGSVHTTTGETWITADGGRTWRSS